MLCFVLFFFLFFFFFLDILGWILWCGPNILLDEEVEIGKHSNIVI